MTDRRFIATTADLAETVRSGRLTLGWTEQQLANHAHVTREFVGDVEDGRPRAEFAEVLAVLDALGIHALAIPSTRPVTPTEINLDDMLRDYARQ